MNIITGSDIYMSYIHDKDWIKRQISVSYYTYTQHPDARYNTGRDTQSTYFHPSNTSKIALK